MPVLLPAWIALAVAVQPTGITEEYMEDRTMRVYACPCEWLRSPEEARSWAEVIHDPFIALSGSAFATTTQVRYTGRGLNIRWTSEEDAISGDVGIFVDENRLVEF